MTDFNSYTHGIIIKADKLFIRINGHIARINGTVFFCFRT